MERAQLSAARERKFWTIERAAERFGVHPVTVFRWENGLAFPRLYTLGLICKEYGMSAEELGLVREAGPKRKAKKMPVVQEKAHEQAPVVLVEKPALVVQMPREQVPSPDAPDVVGGSYAAFLATDIALRCQHIIQHWPVHTARYHDLQAVITLEIEDDNSMQDPINRRDAFNALRRIAGLAIELCSLSALMPVLRYPIEEILPRCAAGITACWHLQKGSDLAFVSEVVSAYIPTLQEIVRTAPEFQRKAAADLLAQSLFLKAISIGFVEGNYTSALHYKKQAETYAELAENPALVVASIRGQASSYGDLENWEQAMRTAEKAKYLIETAKEPISLHLQSMVYAGLANYQACTGQKYKQDAFRSLGKAQSAFFAASSDPEPIFIGTVAEAGLLISGGLTYYHFGMAKDSIDSFAKIDTITAKQTQHIDSHISRVMTEVSRDDQPRNMEFCIDHLTQGLQGAIVLRSEHSFTESKVAYAAMRGAWPGEKRVKDLRDLIVHW